MAVRRRFLSSPPRAAGVFVFQHHAWLPITGTALWCRFGPGDGRQAPGGGPPPLRLLCHGCFIVPTWPAAAEGHTLLTRKGLQPARAARTTMGGVSAGDSPGAIRPERRRNPILPGSPRCRTLTRASNER